MIIIIIVLIIILVMIMIIIIIIIISSDLPLENVTQTDGPTILLWAQSITLGLGRCQVTTQQVDMAP